MKVALDLSNYAIKADFKNATGVDTSYFPKITNLTHLKSGVDKLDINKLKSVPSNLRNLTSKIDKIDIDKLVTVPVDLIKLSDLVKSHVLEKDLYNVKIRDIEIKYLMLLT